MTIDLTTRNLLISLCSHMAYMQGQLEALHQLDDPDDHYWFRESVALQQKVADHLAALADEPAEPPLYARQTGIGQWEGADHFRALCADLIEAVLSDDSHIDCTEIARRARAALAKADEPAVPQGREPAAVTGQPSDEELANTYWKAWHEYHDRTNSVLHSVGLRAVLARWGHQPAPPADGEVAEFVEWLQEEADDYKCIGCEDSAAKCNRAAELLQRQAPVQPADGEVAGLVADLQQQANHGFSDLTRNLLINLASHMAYMQGQLQARHDPDEDDLEDCYWYAESVALRQMVSDALAGKPAALLPLADTHYEWELEDAKGEWQAGGSSNSQSDVEREGMRYLQTYTQDGPHKLIIRQHTTQTINEITNG